MSSWQMMLQHSAEKRGDYSFKNAPNGECCELCRNWRRLCDRTGECHAHAPCPKELWICPEYQGPQDWSHKSWPVTYYNDWCGDFTRRIE